MTITSDSLEMIYRHNEARKTARIQQYQMESRALNQARTAFFGLIVLVSLYLIIGSQSPAGTIMDITLTLVAFVFVMGFAALAWQLLRYGTLEAPAEQTRMLAFNRPTPEGENAIYAIEVQDWTWQFKDGYALVIGRLRYDGLEPMSDVLVNVRFINKAQQVVDEASALVNKAKLSQGEETDFQIATLKKNDIDQALLYFTLLKNGRFIPSKSLKTADELIAQRRERQEQAQQEIDVLLEGKNAATPAAETPEKEVEPLMRKMEKSIEIEKKPSDNPFMRSRESKR